MALHAQPRDANGQPLDRPVTWSSNNPTYVAVNTSGLVRAFEVGGADITAESEGKTVSVRVWSTQATAYYLSALDDMFLPRTLGTYVHTVPGDGPRNVTVSVREGSMTMDHIAGTYEIVLQTLVTSTAASSLPVPRTYESGGAVSWDAAAGDFVFEPSAFGASFRGRWVAGALDVFWQPEPNLPAATFTFELE